MTTTEETTVVIGGSSASGSFTGILAIAGKQVPFKKSPPLKPWGDVMRLGKRLKAIDTTDPDPEELEQLEQALRDALGACISDDKSRELYYGCEELGFFHLTQVLTDYVKRVNAGVPTPPS